MSASVGCPATARPASDCTHIDRPSRSDTNGPLGGVGTARA